MEKQEADWRAQSEKLTDTNEKIAVWKGKNQELEVLGIEVQETEDLLKDVETQKKLAKKARETYQKNRTRYDAKSQEYESMRRIFWMSRLVFWRASFSQGNHVLYAVQ